MWMLVQRQAQLDCICLTTTHILQGDVNRHTSRHTSRNKACTVLATMQYLQNFFVLWWFRITFHRPEIIFIGSVHDSGNSIANALDLTGVLH